MLDMLDYLGGGCSELKGSIDTRALAGIIETEDTAEATLYFDGNLRGHFFATNTYCQSDPVEITLTFERGAVRYIGGKLFDGGFNLIAEDKAKIDAGKAYWGSSHGIITDNFYSSLAGFPKPYPSLSDGLRATELALGLYESARTNIKYEMKG